MAGSMARVGGRGQQKLSDMRVAMIMAKSAQGWFLHGTIEVMQQKGKTPCSLV